MIIIIIMIIIMTTTTKTLMIMMIQIIIKKEEEYKWFYLFIHLIHSFPFIGWAKMIFKGVHNTKYKTKQVQNLQ